MDALPAWIEPMLAVPDGGALPTGPNLAFEHKLDGYRCALRVAADGTVALTSRNGNDFTDEFPTVAGAFPDGLDGQPGIVDGEIVAYNASGQADFSML